MKFSLSFNTKPGLPSPIPSPRFFIPTALFLCLGLLVGCSSNVSQKQLAKQEQLYKEETAIISKDGAKVIDYELDAIPNQAGAGQGNVVVVAWKSASSANDYYNAPGSLDTLHSPYLTWIVQESQYPTMIDRLHLDRLSGQKLALRLEQALGLPPAADTTKVFLVMEMKAKDLFRPCRDPNISDCNCSLEFPSGYYSSDTSFLTVYKGLIKSTEGYPWSRLGYTYDWKKSSRKHFGFSEYIIRQGAVVKIVGKVPTEEYIASFD